MTIINFNVGDKSFTINGKSYLKIYQPISLGEKSIGIYNIYDSRFQILGATPYDEITVNGNVLASQDDLIDELMNGIYQLTASGTSVGEISTGLIKLDLVAGRVYGDTINLTGDILIDDNQSVLGGSALIYHNSGTIPNITTDLDLINFGSYVTNGDNLITISKIGSNKIGVIYKELVGGVVADTTAPTFISTYPKSVSISDTTFSVEVQLNEVGTAYLTVVPDGTAAPTSQEVKDGTATGAIASRTISVTGASTTATMNVSGLSASTAYDVYLVAEDDEGTPNIQSTPTKLDVSTIAVAPTTTYDAVWSLDKVSNPTYTGASIQVRRADGSATADIGFVGDELDTAAIDGFAGNDTVQVITIYDKTGNNNHLTYTTGSRPVIKASGVAIFTQGGKPAIKFSGLDARLVGGSALTGEAGLSIYVVHYNDTISGDNKGILGKWGGTFDEYNLVSRSFSTPFDVSFGSKNSSNTQTDLKTSVVLDTKALRLFTILYDSGTSNKYVRINGTQVGTQVADIRANDSLFQVGGYAGTSTNETMFISEIRLKKGYMTDFASEESELITKYSIV